MGDETESAAHPPPPTLIWDLVKMEHVCDFQKYFVMEYYKLRGKKHSEEQNTQLQ